MLEQIGHWQLRKLLGSGGQGSVYLVVNATEGADQAMRVLKTLKNVGNAQAMERFQREASALSVVDHPGIVRTIETAVNHRPPYYVMPYESGARTLASIIWGASENNPFRGQVGNSIAFVGQCAEAISAAHDASVIHRDLKPDNILVRKDGSPLIIDFGCCFIVDDREPITLTNEGVGARHFMAPECEAGASGQIRGYSDVYSLGKILWCMITGDRPFSREKPAFANQCLLNLLPDDAAAGFAVELMMASIRQHPANRVRSARDFATTCAKFAKKIKAGTKHVSYLSHFCPVCLDPNTSLESVPIYKITQAGGFVNSENQRYTGYECEQCGFVGIRSSASVTKFQDRLKAAANEG